MRRHIRNYWQPFVAVIGLAAIAAVVGGYILVQQRARLPFLSETPVRMHVALDNAQAVTPGQGQTVQVAGVKIGSISGVNLEDGRAIVDVDIEPQFVDLIRTDARAILRPRTGLKDMYIQLSPGKGERADEGFTIPVERTLTDVDLDEILEGLDARTRDYVTLLVNGTGEGLRGNGAELAEVFERFGPTTRDLATVSRAVTARKGALKRFISAVADLNGRLAEDPEDLTQLVDGAARTFGAFAAEQEGLRSAVRELPDTLKRATRTFERVQPFAAELGPATEALQGAMPALLDANAALRPFARRTLAPVRDELRPFAREARPLVRDLAPAAEDLSELSPELTRVLRVANRFFNMAAYNPDGREGPEDADREEGFLFWLAWAAHNTVNLFNIDDANGPMRPLFLTGTCGTLASVVDVQPELESALGLSPVLATLCGDPRTTSVDAELRGRMRKGGKDGVAAAERVLDRALRRSARR